MGSIEVYDAKQEKWVPYVPDYNAWYQHFKDLRDGYVQPDHMGRFVVCSGKKYRKLKEIETQEKEMEAREKQLEAHEKQKAAREQKSPTLKQITPIAQAIEIAKSEIERKRKENDSQSITGGNLQRRKCKATVDWNSFRYLKMNSKQLYDMLLGYPVTICTADQLKIQRGRFFISNTDTSQGPGEHWVAFYFPKRGPFQFFDSLGHMQEDYGVGFEKILKRKYLKNVGQLQQSTSNVCGLYCAYYVIKRHQGKTMKDIVKDFNVEQKKRNDSLIVTKMMKLCTRKRPVQRK